MPRKSQKQEQSPPLNETEEEWAYNLLELKSGYPLVLFAMEYEKKFDRRPPPYLMWLYLYMVEKLSYEGKWGKFDEEYWYKEYEKDMVNRRMIELKLGKK